ncbi:MAG TPA: hypothetical protein VN032_08380 [Thermoanaerobaculia bacterium]|jgi:hypothetical protein|nr:hypothetical protein [Thermoanaerobaculia bacterium]
MKRASAAAWLALLVLGATCVPAFAQSKSPEETARSIAARWKPMLGLSDEQTTRFEAVALDAEKKTAAARAASGADQTKLREALRPILEERNAAVVKILTPGQVQKYDAAMALARKKAAEKPAASTPGKPPG